MKVQITFFQPGQRSCSLVAEGRQQSMWKFLRDWKTTAKRATFPVRVQSENGGVAIEINNDAWKEATGT